MSGVAGYASRRAERMAAEFRVQEAREREEYATRLCVRYLTLMLDFLHALPSDRPKYEQRMRLEVARRGQHIGVQL